MSLDHILSQPPHQLADQLNRLFVEQQCTLEQWIQRQTLDRECVLQHLEHGGYVYNPERNRIE
ncbi:MAG: hypothetical protein WEB07_01825 [Natronospirillum sp.]